MATVNLGRIKPVFRGAWTTGSFVVDDIVTHGNESFICIQAHGAGTQATTQTAYWTKLAAKGTDGTDVGTTLTTQGDILFRDGSGLQRLAKGTASQELRMNSGATAPEWYTPAVVTSDFTLLSTVTASSSASVSFDGFFSATYRDYLYTFSNVIPATDAEHLDFRVRKSNADITSSTYYGWASGSERYSGGSNHGTQGTDYWARDAFKLTGHSGTLDSDVEAGGASGQVKVFNPLSTTHRHWAQTEYSHYNNTMDNVIGGSGRMVTATSGSALSGHTFYMTSGNIAEGVFKLYGLK